MARKRSSANPVKQLTVVFDHGGVLSGGHDPIPDLHREVGGDLEALREAYWTARPAFDLGELSTLDYWISVLAAARNDEPSVEEIEHLQGVDNHYWGTLAPGARALIHDLARNGVRLVLLSNAPAAFGAYVRTQDWFEAFALAVISGEEHVTKPSREIYEIVLEAVAHETGGVARPSKVIFFDDRIDNVEAAREIGIDAHLWPRNGDEAPDGESGWELAREILSARSIPME
ncbi:MAG: HAD-IA family hydrolase [Dermabacter sp.]|nr:HAD-IA family hydrolase [Dermabacter sp.]